MKTIVIGATGGIGHALVTTLESRGDAVIRLARTTTPPLDLLDETSIARAAALCGDSLDLVLDATGILQTHAAPPEKSWRAIDPAHMAHHFAVNAIGPALLMKHFLPRLARDRRAVFATLSARVGSIADNRLGGWYSYRAAKAALNQLVRTAAIELARSNPHALCVALHPGTVDTPLSKPFARTGLDVLTPAQSAEHLLAVLDCLTPAQTGLLFDYRGVPIAF